MKTDGTASEGTQQRFFNMKNHCTGVILAGGQNSRFFGTNKALVRVGGKKILDHIHDVFRDLFHEIILVTNDPTQYLQWNVNIVTDIFPVRSSLTGIHTGLFYTSTPYAFFAACDIPFLKKELVETLVGAIEPRIDIVIPETSKGFEPLCAVYSKRCFKPLEAQLAENELKIQQVFQKVRVKRISEDILRKSDPDLRSFYNINTPDDLAKANNIATGPTEVTP